MARECPDRRKSVPLRRKAGGSYASWFLRRSSLAACSMALAVASLILNLATSVPSCLHSTTLPGTLTRSKR